MRVELIRSALLSIQIYLLLIGREIKPYEDKISLALKFPASHYPQYKDLNQKYEELEFLLEGDGANILMELSIEQERFEQAMESLRQRNLFHINEIHPAIEFTTKKNAPQFFDC